MAKVPDKRTLYFAPDESKKCWKTGAKLGIETSGRIVDFGLYPKIPLYDGNLIP